MSNEPSLQEKSNGRKIADWFQDTWPHLLRDFGSIGLAIVAVWTSSRTDTPSSFIDWVTSWIGWLLACSIAVAIVGTLLVRARSRRISEVLKQNTDLQAQIRSYETELEQLVRDYSSIISDFLSDLANNSLEFGDTERISVYKHDGRAFVMLGRYSKNPNFNQHGRGIYPDNQGCIGAAWAQGGEAFEAGLPDPNETPGLFLEANYQRWSMPYETSNELTMKSRSFAAFALESRNQHRIAVVVFESTRTDILDNEQLRSMMLSGTAGRWLSGMIESMRPVEPSPSYASRKGF